MHTMRLRRVETGSLGGLLLAVWLIATAVLLLAKVAFAHEAEMLAALAIAAGVLLPLRTGGKTTALGTMLLSIWLIATGLLILAKISFADQPVIMAVLGVAAGILILLTDASFTRVNQYNSIAHRLRRSVDRRRGIAVSLGWLLLAIWLIVEGALVVLKVGFPESGVMMAVVALAAGVLILLRR